jgi:hypothetical protein
LVALSCEASIPSASLNGHIAFTDRLTGPTFPERDMFRRDRLTTGHIQCHDQLAWVYEGDMHVGDVLPNSNLFLFLFCSIKFSAHGESIRGPSISFSTRSIKVTCMNMPSISVSSFYLV